MKKRGMDKLELNYIMNELNVIEKSFFRKAYKKEDLIKLKFSKGSIAIIKGKAAFIYEKEITTEQNPFINKLREELNNKYVEKIYLKDGDRYLVIEFNEYLLIFELFSKGNAILCDKEMNKIIEMNNRKSQEKYEFSTQPFDFEYYLKKMGEKPIGATLTRMLGKRYKDYILEKLSIEEKVLTSEVDKEAVKEEINKLMAFGKPTIKKDEEGEIEDYGVEIYENSMESLSRAAELYYSKEIDEKELKRKRTENRILETIKGYEKEIEQLEKAIEKIKEKQYIYEELLYNIRKNKVDEEMLRDYEKKLEASINGVDKKNKEVIIEIKVEENKEDKEEQEKEEE